MKIICSILLASCLSIYSVDDFNIDFDHAMGKDHHLYADYYAQAIDLPLGLALLHRYKNLYTDSLTKIKKSTLYKIPKKIHQIWLGSPVPEKYTAYRLSWVQAHPEWEYILWTDKEIENFNLENYQAYQAAINYAERSDIARYEILYRLGGLYIDTDFQCIKPFDSLHIAFDFYTGLELPCMATALSPLIIPNGLIGCKAGHPILGACIQAIKNNSLERDDNIVAKTGPILFTKVTLAHINSQNNCDIIFPASVFYPIDKNIKNIQEIESCITSQTFAIHHWAGSWILKEAAFVPGIKIQSSIQKNKIKFKIVDTRC